MKPKLSFIEKIKLWLCKTVGHNKKFSHFYGGNVYVCKRCGLVIKENDR